MYYFNLKLMNALPELLRVPKYKLSEQCNLGKNVLSNWMNGPVMSVGKFVDFLNTLHLSMADFLIVGPDAPLQKRKEDYVIPQEIWKPIVWKNERIKVFFGEGSITGVPSRVALAESLGLADYKAINRWILQPYTMNMSTLLDLLNKHKVDAKELIHDPNRQIRKPDWRPDANSERLESALNVLEEVLENSRRQVRERDSLIANQNIELDRLRKENEALRQVGGGSIAKKGWAAESSQPYGNPFAKHRYVFHKQLLAELPGVYGMTVGDFCKEYGIKVHSLYDGNIKMKELINLCNGIRMSITHFFPPSDEPLVVNHRSWYEISPRMFKPIISRLDNLKYIFRKSTFGFSQEQLHQVMGIGWVKRSSFAEEGGGRIMALTVLDICNSFNIPISSFVSDPNDRKRPSYSVSLNETLIENCVSMAKELEKCRKTIRGLKEKTEGLEEKD